MKRLSLVTAATLAVAMIAASFACAQSDSAAPSSGVAQPAYDVPFVPTPQEVVGEMLKMAKVGPTDYVIDLGSGDGRIVLTAVRQYGARGFGVDLNPDHITRSNEAARQAGIADRATFANANLFNTDISKATVLTMYLLPDVNLKLRPRLLNELKPGTRVVSHDFDMGEWKPDQQSKVGAGRTHSVYYWVVPAKVGGTWTINTKSDSAPVQLTFNQKFQEIDGQAHVGDSASPLRDARLEGDRIAFTLVASNDSGREVPLRFEGRVDGNSIDGTVAVDGSNDQVVKWHAVKA